MIKKYDLHNKNVFISGVSSGIGRQLALQLSKKYGCKIFGVARNAEKLEKVKAEIGTNLMYMVMDISKKENWDKLCRCMQDKNFYPDLVINNAGIIHPFDNFLNLSDEETDSVINTNYKSLIYSFRAFVPMLKKRRPCDCQHYISGGYTSCCGYKHIFIFQKGGAQLYRGC